MFTKQAISYKPYPGSSHSTWDKIPLGVIYNGGAKEDLIFIEENRPVVRESLSSYKRGHSPKSEVIWDTAKAPNILIGGNPGSGKTVAQHTIITHCLEFPLDWAVVILDIRGFDYRVYEAQSSINTTFAGSIETIHKAFRDIINEMVLRHKRMNELDISDFKKLPESPSAIMIVVDYIDYLLSSSGVKTDEGKLEDKLKAEMLSMIEEISTFGSMAGVHLSVSSSRFLSSINHSLKDMFQGRLVFGRLDSSLSEYISRGNQTSQSINGRNHPGFGRLEMNGLGADFKGYFVDEDYILR